MQVDLRRPVFVLEIDSYGMETSFQEDIAISGSKGRGTIGANVVVFNDQIAIY